MKIAVITESSTCEKNKYIIEALKKYDHEVFNVGMTDTPGESVMSYINTSFMTAMLLHLKAVDFVVGGCGTGQGYAISSNDYPGVFCGLIYDALEAWLFVQINAGNAISLVLNKGFGWAANENIKLIFDALFSAPVANGYPEHRKIPQKEAREALNNVSLATHKKYEDILVALDPGILKHCAKSEPFLELLKKSSGDDKVKDLYLELIGL